MLLGMICVAAEFAGYNYLSRNQRFVADLKRDYPMVCLIAVFICGYAIISLLGSVMVFMFGVLLPVTCEYNIYLINLKLMSLKTNLFLLFLSAVFIHASLRLRNTKNKIASIKEQLSFNKSPMTILLDELGMKFEGFDD